MTTLSPMREMCAARRDGWRARKTKPLSSYSRIFQMFLLNIIIIFLVTTKISCVIWRMTGQWRRPGFSLAKFIWYVYSDWFSLLTTFSFSLIYNIFLFGFLIIFFINSTIGSLKCRPIHWFTAVARLPYSS